MQIFVFYFNNVTSFGWQDQRHVARSDARSLLIIQDLWKELMLRETTYVSLKEELTMAAKTVLALLREKACVPFLQQGHLDIVFLHWMHAQRWVPNLPAGHILGLGRLCVSGEKLVPKNAHLVEMEQPLGIAVTMENG